MLMKRGWALGNVCSLCKLCEELVGVSWSHFDSLWQNQDSLDLDFNKDDWVFPNYVKIMLFQWYFKSFTKKQRVVWRLIPILLFRCIWGECNQRTFEDKEM